MERRDTSASNPRLSWEVALGRARAMMIDPARVQPARAFRAAFRDFSPSAVAAFDDEDVTRLMADEGIVRNRLKIAAAISNARALLALHEEGGRLSEVVARHTPAPRGRAPLPLGAEPWRARDPSTRGPRPRAPTPASTSAQSRRCRRAA